MFANTISISYFYEDFQKIWRGRAFYFPYCDKNVLISEKNVPQMLNIIRQDMTFLC